MPKCIGVKLWNGLRRHIIRIRFVCDLLRFLERRLGPLCTRLSTHSSAPRLHIQVSHFPSAHTLSVHPNNCTMSKVCVVNNSDAIAAGDRCKSSFRKVAPSGSSVLSWNVRASTDSSVRPFGCRILTYLPAPSVCFWLSLSVSSFFRRVLSFCQSAFSVP